MEPTSLLQAKVTALWKRLMERSGISWRTRFQGLSSTTTPCRARWSGSEESFIAAPGAWRCIATKLCLPENPVESAISHETIGNSSIENGADGHWHDVLEPVRLDGNLGFDTFPVGCDNSRSGDGTARRDR